MKRKKEAIIGAIVILVLIPIIYFFIKSGDPETDMNKIYSQLETAISNDDISSVKSIIETNNIDINNTAYKPLCSAASYGANNIVNYLISKDADTEITCNNEKTPLVLAVKYKNNETAKILIENGAKTDNRDNRNKSLLYFAAINTNKDLIEYFVDNEIFSIDEVDKSGFNIVHYASQSGNINFFKWVIDTYGEDIMMTDSLEINYLHLSALVANEEFFNYFLEEGISPTELDLNGNNILHYAAFFDKNYYYDDRFFLFFETLYNTYGDQLEENNNEGLNYLHIAIINDNYGFVKFLIEEKNYDVNEKFLESGNTLLMYAIINYYEYSKVTSLLIENGADVNLTNNTNSTALMYAVSNRDKYYVNKLLARGADKTITNNENKTALDISIELGYDEITALLQ